MGLERFRRNRFSVTPFLFALSFSILLTTAAHTQTKPERQSKAAKAAKPGETTQTAQPTAGAEGNTEVPNPPSRKRKPSRG